MGEHLRSESREVHLKREPTRALVLDRDGVLIESVRVDSGKTRAAFGLEEYSLMAGAKEAVEILTSLRNYIVIVVTNQPDVNGGRLATTDLEAINTKLMCDIPQIREIYVCPHESEENCGCKKPRTGLLEAAIRKYQLDISDSWLIGDRWVDVLAGKSAGLKTVLVENENSWHPSGGILPPRNLEPCKRVNSITEAAEYILKFN